MSTLQHLKEMVPYGWRKGLLDLVRPERPGIGPVLRRMERNISVAFDIGANVGDVSLYLLHYFPRATVFAFEPCAETYGQLVANVMKAGYGDRFRPFRFGFFDEETEGMLHVTSAHGANSLVAPGEEYRSLNPCIETVATERIALMRLDDFVARERIDRIDLVKIDVEGVEQQVLRGGADTFASRVQTVVIEVSFVRRPRGDGEYIRLFQLLHDYGFAPAEIYDLSHAQGAGAWKLAQFDCVFRKY
ncbi:MAG: FkbM family [Geobacteraceae bacterium]|nr:MAG: FkbM family [Geobacteraceae bacterium]